MIINDKYLNSKSVYELPEGVQVEEYRRGGNREPLFTPDVCINARGTVGLKNYKETAFQLCITSTDKGLLKYLEGYNWGAKFSRVNSIVGVGKCNKWQVEKIISEYYANIK